MGAGGKGTDEATEPPPLELRSDPRFAPFFGPEFSVADFASRALADGAGSPQAEIDRLKDGIAVLDGIVRQEVTRRQTELLGQACQLRDAEGHLSTVSGGVGTISTSVARTRANILEPYLAIRSRTRQLENLVRTATTLRGAVQAVKLLGKLHVQLEAEGGGLLDLAKAAKLVSDIEALLAEADVAGVACVDAELPFLRGAAANMRREAKKTLLSGMESLNQAEVGSALQVFFNLNHLKQELAAVLQQYESDLHRTFSSALDPKALAALQAQASSAGGGGRAAVGGGGAVKFPEALWQGLGGAFESLQRAVTATWHLQRVLAKKRDPLSHVVFLDEVAPNGAPQPLELLWGRVTGMVREAMETAAHPQRGGVAREVLVANYPRLAVMMEELLAAIRRETEVKDALPALSAEQEGALVAASAPFQSAYLAASLARLTDGVNVAFPGGSRALQSAAELQKCIARIHEEVKVASGSPRLCVLVAGGVGKALQLLAEKAVYMAATGPDMRMVAAGCNAQQGRNITLCNALQEVHRSMLQLLQKLPHAAAQALRVPLDAVQGAGMEVVTPLFRGLVEAAEGALLAMHSEAGYGAAGPGGGPGEVAGCAVSKYMAELTGRTLMQWRQEYLSKFSPPPTPAANSIAAALVERMASRVLVFFVRHASLLRPLTPAGRVKLAKDAAELEAGVSSHLFPCEHLGPPFRMLRAFRPLVFSPTASLPTSPLRSELPASVLLHHLYARAPPALQSPHERSGLSPAQYSVWLDQHSMEEVVSGVRKALNACADAAKGEEGFDEVFPVMLRLCDDASGGK